MRFRHGDAEYLSVPHESALEQGKNIQIMIEQFRPIKGQRFAAMFDHPIGKIFSDHVGILIRRYFEKARRIFRTDMILA